MQREIIDLARSVELVIVAAGAADGQTEEDSAGRVGDIVEDLLPALFEIGSVVLVGPEPVEAGATRASGLSGSNSSPASCWRTKRS